MFSTFTTTLTNFLNNSTLATDPLSNISIQSVNSEEDVAFYKNPDYLITVNFTNPKTQMDDSVTALMPESFNITLDAEYTEPMAGIGEALSDISPIAKAFGHKIGANIFSMKSWDGSTHTTFSVAIRLVAMTDAYKDIIEPIHKLAYLCVPSVDEASSNPNGLVQLGFINSPGPTIGFAEGTTPTSFFSDVTNAVSTGSVKVYNGAAKAVTDTVSSATDNNKNTGVMGTAMNGVVGIADTAVESLGTAIGTALQSLVIKNNISLVIGRFTKLRSVVLDSMSNDIKMKADENGNLIEAELSLQFTTLLSPTDVDIPYMFGYAYAEKAKENLPVKKVKSVTDIFNTSGPSSNPVGQLIKKLVF